MDKVKYNVFKFNTALNDFDLNKISWFMTKSMNMSQVKIDRFAIVTDGYFQKTMMQTRRHFLSIK